MKKKSGIIELFIEDLGRVTGGTGPEVTTMALGEEGSEVTTMALGEEGPEVTTMALGEEGPEAVTSVNLGEF